MEVKAEYKTTFAVAAEPAHELTTAELRQIKAEYIERGLNLFDSLAVIVCAFGNETEERHRVYRVWQRGNITAYYSIEIGVYLPKEERYQETEVLSIFLNCHGMKGLANPDRVQVCYLRDGDAVIEPEQRFIPGKWLEAMLSEHEAALQVARQQQAEMDAAERARLCRELMIGADI